MYLKLLEHYIKELDKDQEFFKDIEIKETFSDKYAPNKLITVTLDNYNVKSPIFPIEGKSKCQAKALVALDYSVTEDKIKIRSNTNICCFSEGEIDNFGLFGFCYLCLSKIKKYMRMTYNSYLFKQKLLDYIETDTFNELVIKNEFDGTDISIIFRIKNENENEYKYNDIVFNYNKELDTVKIFFDNRVAYDEQKNINRKTLLNVIEYNKKLIKSLIKQYLIKEKIDLI